MKNPQDIPWKRLIAEGGAVVVSILLAFWIDAWWNDRNEEMVFKQNLLALEQEISQNLSNLDSVLSLIDGALESLDVVFHLLADPDLRVFPESFTDDISDAYYYWASDITDNAFDVVVRPANLRRIENIDLRFRIVMAKESIADVSLYQRLLIQEFAERQGPNLVRNFVLSDFSWYDEAELLQQSGLLHPVPKSSFTLDYEFVRSREFWNLLYNWRAFYLDYANSLLTAKGEHQIILELLESELDHL
jgi:hypothetical protein